MLLTIDCGNTNIVFALFDGDNVRGEWRTATHAERTADEFGVWLSQVMTMSGLDRSMVDGCIIASVVPALDFSLKSLCRRYFGKEPLIVGEEGVKLGIGINMERPEEVGADRLVNAVAAHAAYGGPLIIIDFGTATTFDVVDGDGNYCGGAIAPGTQLVDGSAAHGGRQVAARRHRPAAPGPGDRQDHGGGDALGHLLGLCRDDRRAWCAASRTNSVPR